MLQIAEGIRVLRRAKREADIVACGRGGIQLFQHGEGLKVGSVQFYRVRGVVEHGDACFAAVREAHLHPSEIVVLSPEGNAPYTQIVLRRKIGKFLLKHFRKGSAKRLIVHFACIVIPNSALRLCAPRVAAEQGRKEGQTQQKDNCTAADEGRNIIRHFGLGFPPQVYIDFNLLLFFFDIERSPAKGTSHLAALLYQYIVSAVRAANFRRIHPILLI